VFEKSNNFSGSTTQKLNVENKPGGNKTPEAVEGFCAA